MKYYLEISNSEGKTELGSHILTSFVIIVMLAANNDATGFQ